MSRSSSVDDPTTELTPWAAAALAEDAGQTGPRQLLAGRYEVLGLLGQGGMGSVYRVRDLELDELCALKMLRRDGPFTPRALERFRREVKLARRVTHVNVARTFDIGEHEGEKFLTMELVEGEPLSALLAREGKLAPQRAAHIATAVCAGLGAAHAVGVVHRDLKPDNVMLERGGRVVIMDFGIAHARRDDVSRTLGGAVGTPAYMAPEQVSGEDVDGRADLYALGVMLFEMLTGKMPFAGDTPYSVASARLLAPPPDPRTVDPSLPEWLSGIVRRCLARRREDRWEVALDVGRALAESSYTLPDLQTTRDSPPWAPPDPSAITRPGEKTVAVLPLRNAGPPEDEYLADGLTEDLIDTLSTMPGLKVRPRGAALGLVSGTADPRDVGKRLGVQVIVEGTLRRLSDTIRLSARAVGVDDGFQLWAKRFDRPASDLLVVSDEAARAIADALTVGARSCARDAPTDPRAIELYLRARAEFRKLWEIPVAKAVELLEQAHALAPSDATILASYARARARQWFYEGRAEQGQRARDLAQQAISKAPERGETWLALAQVRFVECDGVSTARLLRTALSLSPLSGDAHELLGDLMLEVGDVSEALARLRTAQSLEPGLRTRYTVARARALIGDARASSELLALEPEDDDARAGLLAIRARLSLWSGQLSEGLSVPSDLPGTLPAEYARVTLELLGRGSFTEATRDFVEQHLARTHDAARFAAFKRQLAAELFSACGERDRALASLSEAVAAGLLDENWLRRCPALVPLHEHSAFERAVRVVAERAERVRRALAEA